MMVVELLKTSSTWHLVACLTVSSVKRHVWLPPHLAQRPVVSARGLRQAPACCGMFAAAGT